MNQAHINFQDNLPIGIDINKAYEEVIKHIYIQSLKYNKRMYIIGSYYGMDRMNVTGLASIFIEQYWNGKR